MESQKIVGGGRLRAVVATLFLLLAVGSAAAQVTTWNTDFLLSSDGDTANAEGKAHINATYNASNCQLSGTVTRLTGIAMSSALGGPTSKAKVIRFNSTQVITQNVNVPLNPQKTADKAVFSGSGSCPNASLTDGDFRLAMLNSVAVNTTGGSHNDGGGALFSNQGGTFVNSSTGNCVDESPIPCSADEFAAAYPYVFLLSTKNDIFGVSPANFVNWSTDLLYNYDRNQSDAEGRAFFTLSLNVSSGSFTGALDRLTGVSVGSAFGAGVKFIGLRNGAVVTNEDLTAGIPVFNPDRATFSGTVGIPWSPDPSLGLEMAVAFTTRSFSIDTCVPGGFPVADGGASFFADQAGALNLTSGFLSTFNNGNSNAFACNYGYIHIPSAFSQSFGLVRNPNVTWSTDLLHSYDRNQSDAEGRAYFTLSMNASNGSFTGSLDRLTGVSLASNFGSGVKFIGLRNGAIVTNEDQLVGIPVLNPDRATFSGTAATPWIPDPSLGLEMAVAFTARSASIDTCVPGGPSGAEADGGASFFADQPGALNRTSGVSSNNGNSNAFACNYGYIHIPTSMAQRFAQAPVQTVLWNGGGASGRGYSNDTDPATREGCVSVNITLNVSSGAFTGFLHRITTTSGCQSSPTLAPLITAFSGIKFITERNGTIVTNEDALISIPVYATSDNANFSGTIASPPTPDSSLNLRTAVAMTIANTFAKTCTAGNNTPDGGASFFATQSGSLGLASGTYAGSFQTERFACNYPYQHLVYTGTTPRQRLNYPIKCVVQDDRGNPVEGASVVALKAASPLTQVTQSTSDSTGNVTLIVPSSSYQIEATKPQFLKVTTTAHTNTPGGDTCGLTMKPKRVIFIIIDGLKSDSLQRYLGVASQESTLRKFRDEGRLATNVTTVFPSFTAAAHTSIFTGAYPGTHGITGNQILKRDGLQKYRNYQPSPNEFDALRNFSEGVRIFFGQDPSFAANLQSDILSFVETLYDSIKPLHSLAAGEAVHRGSTDSFPQGVDDWKLALEAYQSRQLDERVFERLLSRLKQDGLPQFTSVWLPNVDLIQHDHGVVESEINLRLGTIDNGLRALREALNKTGILDSTAFIITSDHGASNVDRTIFLKDNLSERFYTVYGRLPLGERVEVLVAPNGRMAHLYVPAGTDPRQVAEFIRDHPVLRDQVQEIFLKSSTPNSPPETVKPQGGLSNRLDQLRVNSLFIGSGSQRTGEVVVTAKPGFLFDTRNVVGGQHGSLSPEDSLVPVLVWSPGAITPQPPRNVSGQGVIVDLSALVSQLLNARPPNQASSGDSLRFLVEGP